MEKKDLERPAPQKGRNVLQRSCVSGNAAGLLMAVAIGAVSQTVTGRSAPGFNTISHMVWGERAARQPDWSPGYTGIGLVLNQLACLFWAGCYEAMDHRQTDLPARPVILACTVSALAYLVDYHVVPRRLTPGFELVFPRRSFPFLYAGLAVSLLGGLELRRWLSPQ